MKLTITALLCPPLLIGGSVAAHTLFDKNIDNGSVPMYAQVTHTGNVVFIDEAEAVFYPCRCRQIKGEPHAIILHPAVIDETKLKGFN